MHVSAGMISEDLFIQTLLVSGGEAKQSDRMNECVSPFWPAESDTLFTMESELMKAYHQHDVSQNPRVLPKGDREEAQGALVKTPVHYSCSLVMRPSDDTALLPIHKRRDTLFASGSRFACTGRKGGPRCSGSLMLGSFAGKYRHRRRSMDCTRMEAMPQSLTRGPSAETCVFGVALLNIIAQS